MKVIYDISFFGLVEFYNIPPTGIYRVVGNLGRELIASDRCSISFGAFERDFFALADYHTLKHLFASSEYKEVYLPHFPNAESHYESTCRMAQLNSRITAASGLKKMGLKSARKLNQLYRELFDSDLNDEADLQKAGIFHSPYFPIPTRIRKHKKLKPFLTVYDLIPILLPDFCSEPASGGQPYFKTIMDGIGREDWVVCISQSTKDDLCGYRKDLDPRRIFVTHLGASNWFYPCKDSLTIEKVRSKYKIPPGRYVLSVCTFEPRKNLAHLIRCFAQLIQQERLSDLHLVLVGNLGWKYESIFSELTAKEGLRDRIIITGYVANEDLAALYSNALFFVFPSLYEGFGLPPLEAMQCGVPVITSNTSSLPEVVGNAGITVDPQDGDALGQAMLRLAVDDNQRAELANKSLEQARQFSWAQCANQTLKAYQTAVEQG